MLHKTRERPRTGAGIERHFEPAVDVHEAKSSVALPFAGHGADAYWAQGREKPSATGLGQARQRSAGASRDPSLLTRRQTERAGRQIARLNRSWVTGTDFHLQTASLRKMCLAPTGLEPTPRPAALPYNRHRELRFSDVLLHVHRLVAHRRPSVRRDFRTQLVTARAPTQDETRFGFPRDRREQSRDHLTLRVPALASWDCRAQR